MWRWRHNKPRRTQHQFGTLTYSGSNHLSPQVGRGNRLSQLSDDTVPTIVGAEGTASLTTFDSSKMIVDKRTRHASASSRSPLLISPSSRSTIVGSPEPDLPVLTPAQWAEINANAKALLLSPTYKPSVSSLRSDVEANTRARQQQSPSPRPVHRKSPPSQDKVGLILELISSGADTPRAWNSQGDSESSCHST